jgi:hypothetical protein
MRSFLSLAFVAVAFPAVAADPPQHPGYRVLAQDKGKAAIVGADGKVEWEVACGHNSHDIHLLPTSRCTRSSVSPTATRWWPRAATGASWR